jgi:glycosyltransferase involved in cell wall biosynthesis
MTEKHEPLISVMMPCYNAAPTLARALSSLVCQTHRNWECVLVDDGSTDNPGEVVEAVNDPRVRYHRLERNMGRGVARQTALDLARGQYLAVLDADDWYYPEKLRMQVNLMQDHSQLALLSTGIAVVNERHEMIGAGSGQGGNGLAVRGGGKSFNPVRFPWNSCLIRMEVAKRFKFDPALSGCEDKDYLLRVISDRYYGVVPDMSYTYYHYLSANLRAYLHAKREERIIYRKYQDRFPLLMRLYVLKAYLKTAYYYIGSKMKLERLIVEDRYRQPSLEEKRQFEEARAAVFAQLEEYPEIGGRPVSGPAPANAEGLHHD